MKNIGVIGLGNMGIGIASNLLKNKFQVWGYDVSHDRLNIFEEMGGSLAEIKDFAPECDALIAFYEEQDGGKTGKKSAEYLALEKDVKSEKDMKGIQEHYIKKITENNLDSSAR